MINFCIFNIADNLLCICVLLIYDLNYFELEKNKLKLNDEMLFNVSEVAKFNITQSRLDTLKVLFGLNGENSKVLNDINSIVQNLNVYLTMDVSSVNFKSRILNLENGFSLLEKLMKSIINKELNINNDDHYLKIIKLPIARKIYDKCEIINKFYEFYSMQGYGYKQPFNFKSFVKGIQNLNPIQQNINLQPGSIKYDFSKQNISEFEKLLNWKKYRIYLSKKEYLYIRNRTIDLDLSLRHFPEESIYQAGIKVDLLVKTTAFIRSIEFNSTEPFEQFCNQIFNESILINKFNNVSYVVNSHRATKNLNISDYNSYDLITTDLFYNNSFSYKYELEYINWSSQKFGHSVHTNLSKPGVLKVGSNNSIVQRAKKKVNSKINTFVYKPRYDRIPKQQFVNAPASSLRDSNRGTSFVSGRPLSTHLNNFNPSQKTVNPVYSESSEASANTIMNAQVPQEKELGIVEEKVVITEGTVTENQETKIIGENISQEGISVKVNDFKENIKQIVPQNIGGQIQDIKPQNPQLNFRYGATNTNSNFIQGTPYMGVNFNMNNVNNMPTNNMNMMYNQMAQINSMGQMSNQQLGLNMNIPNNNQYQQFGMGQPINSNPNLMVGGGNVQNPMAYPYGNLRQPMNPMQMNMMNMMNKGSGGNILQPGHNINQNQFNNLNVSNQNAPNSDIRSNIDFNKTNPQQTVSLSSVTSDDKNKPVQGAQPQKVNSTNIVNSLLQAFTQIQKTNQNTQDGFNSKTSTQNTTDKSMDPRVRKKK